MNNNQTYNKPEFDFFVSKDKTFKNANMSQSNFKKGLEYQSPVAILHELKILSPICTSGEPDSNSFDDLNEYTYEW